MNLIHQFVDLIIRQVGPLNVRYLTPITRSQSQGKLRTAYDIIEKFFGPLAEPFLIHSPSILATQSFLTGPFSLYLFGSATSRSMREVVAAAISDGNDCEYCAGSHKQFESVSETFAGDDRNSYDSWARTFRRKDRVHSEDKKFTSAQLVEMYFTVLSFNYVNRLVTTFTKEPVVDSRRSPSLRDRLLALVLQLRAKGATTGTEAEFTTLTNQLLDDNFEQDPLPKAFSWAQKTPAENSMRNWVTHGRLLEQSLTVDFQVDPGVFAFVREQLPNLQQPTELSFKGRITTAARKIFSAPDQYSLAVFATLVAIDPNRITPDEVETAKKALNSEQALVELSSWSAIQAASEISSWI